MINKTIPPEWNLVQLGKVAEIQTGLAKGKKNIKDSIQLPYLRVANVQDGHLDLSEIRNIDVARKEFERYLLKEGDVLLTEGGDNDKLGRGTVWRGEIPTCLHQNHIFVVRTDPNILSPYFLSLLTNSPYGKMYFRESAKQSTNLASINTRQLRAFPVLVPPLSQQSKIVEILSAGDDAIVRTKRLIAAQQTRKKGIMQRLLTGHIRFLGFGGEWARVHLREVFQRNIRRAGNRIVENVLSITASVGFVDQREKFGKVIAGKNIANYILLKHGEFAYNRGNSNAYPQGCIYMLEEFDEGAIPSVYYSFVATSNKVYPPFYKHYFESGALNGQLMRYISSSVRADGLFNISADNFFNILIPLPSLDEQIKITEILTTCDIEIDLQKRKLALLKSQKKGLMQRLLTGELRVKLD